MVMSHDRSGRPPPVAPPLYSTRTHADSVALVCFIFCTHAAMCQLDFQTNIWISISMDGLNTEKTENYYVAQTASSHEKVKVKPLSEREDRITLTLPCVCCVCLCVCGCSFDAIGLDSAAGGGSAASRSVSRGSSTTAAPGETAACLLLLPCVPGRRGSFLYRSSDSDSELSPMSLSRKQSAATSESSASVTASQLYCLCLSRPLNEILFLLLDLSFSACRMSSRLLVRFSGGKFGETAPHFFAGNGLGSSANFS